MMSRGGFDVIIGNPPWREYAKVRKEYRILNYSTENCGNLHGICTERVLALRGPHGRSSFIVQLPLVSSSRMASVRSCLRQRSRSLYVMPFDDRPGRLFDGLEHCRAVIFLSQGVADLAALAMSTGHYQRWLSEFRDSLFQLFEYARPGEHSLFPDLFPKCGTELSRRVLEKLTLTDGQRLNMMLSKLATDHLIFYQEATQYWVKAAIGLPYYAKNGAEGVQPHGRALHFRSRRDTSTAFAALNSSLFYLYFITYGDCFHLSDTLATTFPLASSLGSERRLPQLGRQLMGDLRANGTRETIRTSDGNEITYEEFYGWKSKPIIDEIDCVLAKHYGFTDEELDFIINYDIKYRMGRDAESEHEG